MMKTVQQAKHKTKPYKFSLCIARDIAEHIQTTADQQLISRNLLVNRVLRNWFKQQKQINT